MTEPTTAEMRAWLNAASPQTKIKYQWVDILLGRLSQVEQVLAYAETLASDGPEFYDLIGDISSALSGEYKNVEPSDKLKASMDAWLTKKIRAWAD